MTNLRVRDLMTSRVFSLSPGDDLYAVQNLMDDHNVRHVPVVDDDGDLVGIVSMRDLLRMTSPSEDELPLEMREARMHSRRVRDVMTEEVASTEPDVPLSEAATLMLENKFGCLPVVQGMQLAGILTESDFVRYFAND